MTERPPQRLRKRRVERTAQPLRKAGTHSSDLERDPILVADRPEQDIWPAAHAAVFHSNRWLSGHLDYVQPSDLRFSTGGLEISLLRRAEPPLSSESLDVRLHNIRHAAGFRRLPKIHD